MEECGEEEGDEPAEGNAYEDPDDSGEAPGGEEAAVEAKGGEFYEAYGYDVPKLFYEEDLWKVLDSLQHFGRSRVFARTLRKRTASSSLSDENGTPNPPIAPPMMFVTINAVEKTFKGNFSSVHATLGV